MCELARSDRFSHSSIFFSLYASANYSLAVDLSTVELLLFPTASTVDSILFPFLGSHPLCHCSLSSPSRNPPSYFVLSSRYSSHTTRPFQPAISVDFLLLTPSHTSVPRACHCEKSFGLRFYLCPASIDALGSSLILERPASF